MTKPKPLTFGEHITYFRKALWVNLDYFAAEAQMDKARVQAIEGGATPTPREVDDIVRTLFGLSQDYIFDKLAVAPINTEEKAA